MKVSHSLLSARLGQMDMFNTVPSAILDQLAAQSAILEYEAETVVFRKNEPGHSLYLLLEGGVKVHDEDYTVARLTGGSCFGELALLDEGPRSMSVTTTQPTILAIIERDVFFNVLRNEPEVTRKIVGMLTQRLRYQTDRVVDQLRQREQELTRLVDERTAELMQQKEEAESLRAKAEAEKQEAEYQRHRAEQSEQFEQQFLANMSHEIRTPMNAVMGMTNILLQKNPRDDQRKYLDSIRNSSHALLVILNDILDISKIQAGRMELESTDFSVTQVMEQVMSTLRFRASEKDLAFETRCDPAIPPVLIGDPVRLQQILLNLTGNAVKFTEQGGVGLETRLLASANGTCHLYFEVRDTGIGMTPEQCARAFESFRQAAADTTRKYGGTGLGLSISKQLVELFGGTLAVQSQPGQGSVFSFSIHLKVSAKKSLPKESSLPADIRAGLARLRILVAEDNEYNRVVAVESLQLSLPGVTVVTVENGRAAVEAVQMQSFDLVLMDVNMPEMDGLEATRAIRALPAPLNSLPIIAFTASVTKAEIQRCEIAGMNVCVPKPFKESELLAALHAVANQSASDLKIMAETDEMTEPETVQSSIGLEFLEELTGGNRERIRKYLGLYLTSVQTAIPRIEAALAGNRGDDLRRTVHTLKPQLRMVGLLSAADLATAVETRLLEGAEPASMADETSQLLEQIRQSANIFEDYLRQQA